MRERSATLKALWAGVNEIAVTTEDSARIRALLAEAGIQPKAHVGEPVEFFDGHPDRIAEWVLGQWADVIDAELPILNTTRNVSLHHFAITYPEATS